MRDRVGTVCVVLGALMVLAALALFVANQRENDAAGNAATQALEYVMEAIESAGRFGAQGVSAVAGPQGTGGDGGQGFSADGPGDGATGAGSTGSSNGRGSGAGAEGSAGDRAGSAEKDGADTAGDAAATDSDATAGAEGADQPDADDVSGVDETPGVSDSGLPGTEGALPDPYDTAMTVVDIEGYGYVGCLYVPALGLELPVMSELTTERLYVAPCRFTGSTKTNDLVIGAHNYTRHFGGLGRLSLGDEVVFVDMDGRVWSYAVVDLQVLGPYDVEELIGGAYDLSLFTCTYGGATRVVVRCDLV